MSARRHHYVPKFYLAGFTAEGTQDGRLLVVDQRTGKTWKSSPGGAAHERDFYRIEGDNVAPDAFEADLARIEAQSATVIREVIASLRPPTGEALHQLVTFTTLMATRTPPMREHWGEQEGGLLRKLLHASIANPRGFETLKARARAEGKPLAEDETPENLLEALKNSDIRFPSTWGVKRMLDNANILRPMLAARSWSLFVPEDGAGHFVCSDMPAVVHDPTPRPAWAGPSFVEPESDFTMPLSRGVLLIGKFERESGTYSVNARTVATLNSRTCMQASQIYSPFEDFSWLKRDDTIGNLAALREAIAENAVADESGAVE